MKHRRTILAMSLALLILGGLIAFYLPQPDLTGGERLAIGYFYAINLIGALALVHGLIIPKISVFSNFQQWVLRSLLYAMAISGAYLLGYIFQTILLLPSDQLQDILANQFLQGFVSLVQRPFKRGNPPELLTPELQTMLLSFFSAILLISVVSLIGGYVEIRWRELKQKQAVQQAELLALRTRMEPHFLFNSLNTITSLIRTNPQRAEALLIQLSEIFRYLFREAAQDLVSLESELAFTRRYVDLLMARFGDLLKVEWQITVRKPERKIPPLCLQPLVENAVRHGWVNRQETLKLTIQILEEDHRLLLGVYDNGAGIHPAKLKHLPQQGSALANIAQRLNMLYGERASLKIESHPGEGTRVIITIREA